MENIKNLIRITEDYWFTVDNRQYTLYCKIVREKKEFGTNKVTGEMKTVMELLGYFTDMEHMLKMAVRDGIARKAEKSEIHTIEEYLNTYQELATTLKNAVQV